MSSRLAVVTARIVLLEDRRRERERERDIEIEREREREREMNNFS